MMCIYSEIDKIKPIFAIKSPKKDKENDTRHRLNFNCAINLNFLRTCELSAMLSKQNEKKIESNNICNNTVITL